MASSPTIGARETTQTWAGRPTVAAALRALATIAPAVVSWAVIRASAATYWRPAGTVGLLVWAAQVLVVGSAVVLLVGRMARRLLPLAALYNLSLAFPDRAPSRFKVALRTGNIRNLPARIDAIRVNGYGTTAAETTAHIVELVSALGRHERLTRGHTERVRAYTDLIAEELGVGEEDRAKLRWASMLHDIGKLAVPAEILNKPGKPTDEEWAILASHPVVGGELVEPLADWLGEWRYTASQHHERWDGKGYPARLAGTQISLAGRIVAVADAYDVISSTRTYKKGMSPAAARQELVRCAGGQFDPAVVRAFLNVSLGEAKVRTGAVGWLVELFRGIGSAAAQTTNTAGGIVAAGAMASVAAVGMTVPIDPAMLAAANSKVVSVPIEKASGEVVPATPEVVAPRVAEPAPVGRSSTAAPAEPGGTDPSVDVVEPAPVPPPTPVAVAGSTTTTSRPVATTTTRASSAPVAVDDRVSVHPGDTERIDVLHNDYDRDGDLDPTTLSIVTAPESGHAWIDGTTIRFTAPSRSATVALVYRVCDRTGRCDTARVRLMDND